ncbi:thrombospondin type 3 repeat-containing protein [Patescibacteria group bacterium]|nr:thrombospondin type 3 repeat-containing protein [Patescibacteria group bacterium]MBU1722175.1 thrombospondin type 3 repeat-containing protein [Patescibacteria group bacterium]MBU1901126.1 thrombospondin type 3 repeat-containing protein [Patescibacteria group bacterium]
MRQHPASPLTQEQKTGFVLLLVFCVLAVGLGFLQMRNTLYGPFVVRPASAERDGSVLYEDETVRLQSIDTDQDGLNNYEELYFYETSPYLPDTDSDGVTDKEELDAGQDPLCPAGQDCIRSEEASIEEEVFEFNGINEETTAAIDSLIPQVPEEVELDVNAVVQDPEQIRALLLQSGGITQEQLDTISNDDLLLLVQDVLQEDSLSQ